MDPIRIGMINCDLHAMYYAALMEGYDPVELRDDTVGRGHAAYFYFHLCYADGRVRTAPTVGGFEIAKCWDADRTQAENMARIFNKKRGIACDTVEEVSDDVDLVFIADCNGEGHDHLEKAAPGLGKGVPTFVDKPFAYEYRDALRMLELAQASNTPVMSLSMVGDTDQSKNVPNATPSVHCSRMATVGQEATRSMSFVRRVPPTSGMAIAARSIRRARTLKVPGVCETGAVYQSNTARRRRTATANHSQRPATKRRTRAVSLRGRVTPNSDRAITAPENMARAMATRIPHGKRFTLAARIAVCTRHSEWATQSHPSENVR